MNPNTPSSYYKSNESPQFLVSLSGNDMKSIMNICKRNNLHCKPIVTKPYRKLSSSEVQNKSLCQETDLYNLNIFRHNKQLCTILNDNIIRNLSLRPIVPPSPVYNYEYEHEQWKKRMLVDETWRIKRAVEWLYKEKNLTPIEDYDMDEACELADKYCHASCLEALRKQDQKIIIQIKGIRPFEWDPSHAIDVDGGTIDWRPQNEPFNFLDPQLKPTFIPEMMEE
jgi:hypothetical protein